MVKTTHLGEEMVIMRCNNYNKFIKNIDAPIAFVLGRYLTTGLGVTRSLGRQGVPVVWLSSNPNQIGFHSKYCIGVACPHPKNSEKDYIEFLLAVGESLSSKGVVFPNGDIEATAILKHKKKLERYYHIPMADIDVAEILLNKKKFFQILQKQKIPHAKTFFPIDEIQLESISKDVRYPCIIKPVHSETFRVEFKTKSFKVKSSKELTEGYKKSIKKNQEVIVQEIIPGSASCMHGLNAYYDKTGVPHGVFMYRRIREWPHDFGNGCLIESVKVPELKEIIDPFIKKIGYHGIIDAEFKKDPRDNKFKLIEINARCWMQVGLPARCGSNIPYIAYMDILGKNMAKATSYKEHVKWIFLPDDIPSSVKNMLKGNFSMRKWINSFVGEKEYAIFASDDPLPSFVLIADVIYGAHCYRVPS